MNRPVSAEPAALPRLARFWRCANCRKTIGEVVGARLIVVIHGKEYTWPLAGLKHTCNHCGHPNEWMGE